MSDLTNLMEWRRWAEEGKTLLEALIILNNRHREQMEKLERELNEANAEREQLWAIMYDAYQPLRASGNFELSERIRFLLERGPKPYHKKYEEGE